MVSEFETLEALNEINDALDAGQLDYVKDKIMVLKDKYQNYCDQFDKWADEQAKIEEEKALGESELTEYQLEKEGTIQ